MTTRTTANLNMRKTAGTAGAIITTIPNGSVVAVTGDPWYPVTVGGKSGWVSGAYLDFEAAESTQAPTSRYVTESLALTERMLGLWYYYGGNFLETPFEKKHGDCSGFVGFVAESCGYRPGAKKLYNYSANQMLQNFRSGAWPAHEITRGDEQPMDIVFYGGKTAGHVVYVIGPGRVRGASGGYQSTKTVAQAQALGARVRDDDIDYHKHPIIGIWRPEYPA